MAILYVEFKPCTALDYMVEQMVLQLGLVPSQFRMYTSSDNVVSYSIVRVSEEDETKFSRNLLMLSQVVRVESCYVGRVVAR